MQTTIANSPDISVLDFKIIADLCQGKFLIDLSASAFIGTGAQNVQGAKVKIINPFDVEIKTFGLTFDLTKIGIPASIVNSTFEYPIPKVNTLFQYGLYVITVELTDSTGKKYLVTHNLGICEPNPKNKTAKFGSINAQLLGNCINGKLTVLIDEPPVYKGVAFESKTQNSTLTYPTGGPATPYQTTASAFSVILYEGVHILKSDLCVTYNLTQNNYVRVPYKVSCKKNILCRIDLCCVYDKLAEINLSLDGCDAHKRENLIDVTFDALRLLKTIELGASCGEDISDYIEQLENLLNCKCSCSAAEGTPVSNNTPTKDFTITGCNVLKTVNGLTDTYVIENYAYEVDINPATSFITMSAPTLTDCIKKQQLTFNVAGLYAAVKGLIVNQTEYNYWGTVLNNNLMNIPSGLLACLGLQTAQWNALTFRDKFLALMTKMCTCCAGSSCNALITNVPETDATLLGKTTLLTWANNTSVYKVDVFVDGKFVATVLAPITSFVLAGFNDGATHTYSLIAYCSNGTPGNTLTGTFAYTGCPAIAAPSLSSNNVQNAACPFNLNTLVTAIAGLTIKWNNVNILPDNTSIVPNPAAVTSGTYYAWHVDVNGCASPSSSVIVACAVVGNCTEPLNLLVEKGLNNSALITFSASATTPPSYLVKRKLASDPDVAGSYTTIGAPVFNSSINKYQITDSTLAPTTLYTYKSESQCADGTRPSSFFTFAILNCPTITPTPTINSIPYSFTGAAGVTSYVVRLLDSNDQQVNIQTITPPYGSPITGTFSALTQNTQYKLQITVAIGSYVQVCSALVTQTQLDDVIIVPPPAPGGNLYRYGFTELETASVDRGESEYQSAIQTALTVAAANGVESYTPGQATLSVLTFRNTTDKVVFMGIPSTEAFFTKWSSGGLQTDQPIDSAIGAGVALFFRTTIGSFTYYVTRYQTLFAQPVVFSR